MEYVELNDGTKMPQFGLGVFTITDYEQCRGAVLSALKCGYRSIDTAAIYGNEQAVGDAIKISGVPREEIYLTTKIWVSDFGYKKTVEAVSAALERLGVTYIDLMLIHRPYSDWKGAYRALEDCAKKGVIKSLGVSNFSIEQIDKLMKTAQVMPVLNQVECHPYYQQNELKAKMKERNIACEAWYPLGSASASLLNEPIFADIASRTGKSVVQVILRWHLQAGNIVIPGSRTRSHIEENFDIFDFELTDDEMHSIAALDTGKSMERFKLLQPLVARFIKPKHATLMKPSNN